MASLISIIRSILRLTPFILLLLLVVSCGGPARYSLPADSGDVYTYSGIKGEYKIHVGDTLDIKFFYNPELNENITVRPDGRISLQLIDEVRAVGMTPAALTSLLKEKYDPEIKHPEITVIVRSFSTQKVHVGGEVDSPGMLDIARHTTVLQSISRAGGLKDTARLSEVIVIRRSDENKPVIIPVNLKQVIDGTDIRQDIPLMPYDIVFVPKSQIANINQWVAQYIRNNIPVPLSLNYNVD